jgi:hypothetical protein
MSLREAQVPMFYDQDGQIQGEGWIFVYQPFTSKDFFNWKHPTLSFMKKPQTLIGLMQSIIHTHKLTWTDCRQLLLTLFNIEELRHIMLAALKWLEDHDHEGTLNAQTYAQGHFPEEDPFWDPNG